MKNALHGQTMDAQFCHLYHILKDRRNGSEEPLTEIRLRMTFECGSKQIPDTAKEQSSL